MYFILFYETVDDYIERRKVYRDEHLRLAKEALEKGELVLAGAFADQPNGAAFIFKGSSSSVAEDFAKSDPYVLNGVVKNWNVREWTVVVGN